MRALARQKPTTLSASSLLVPSRLFGKNPLFGELTVVWRSSRLPKPEDTPGGLQICTALAYTVVLSLHKISWSFGEISLFTKLFIHQAAIHPVLTYTCRTWRFRVDNKKLKSITQCCLRHMEKLTVTVASQTSYDSTVRMPDGFLRFLRGITDSGLVISPANPRQ